MKTNKSNVADAAPAAGTSDIVTGLECRIGRAAVMVPVEHVAQILELETSPLPMARRWVNRMGIHDGRLIITVGLMGDKSGEGMATGQLMKSVLLNGPDSAVSWALEVNEVRVLVKATMLKRLRTPSSTGAWDAGAGDDARAAQPGPRRELPQWIERARTEDGRTLGWIDVPAMLAELRSTARGFA